tara:strand:+ start:15196 stop:18855 length:3660 start_codon:yes stop_codon:yes gene_type:complete
MILAEALRHIGQRGAEIALGASVRLIAVLVLGLVFFPIGDARAVASVTTKLSESGGYGRIVLNWPGGLPKHSETLSSGVLVIKFDKAFSVDLEEFARQMPRVVALARQDPDGKTLRLGLKFDYWLNVQEAENSLYVDLLPSNWSGPPPALPADVIARVKAAEEAKQAAIAEEKDAREKGIVDPEAPMPALSVRVAGHDGITRLVFDWNQPVLYSLAQQDGSATITFDRPAKVALAQIRVNPPPYLKTISALERNGRLSVFMKLDSGIVVSDFREDLGIVLDLKPHQVLEPEQEQQVNKTPEATSDHEPEPVHEADAVHDVEAESPAANDVHASTHDEGPKAETHKEEAHAETHEPEPLKVSASPSGQEAEKRSDVSEPELVTPEPTNVPKMISPKAAQVEPETVVSQEPAGAEEAVELVKVTAKTTENRSELSFEWSVPVGAAVFTRSNMLWVVFDQETLFDMGDVDLSVMKGFGTPKSYKLPDATALVFPMTEPDMLIGAEESGNFWRISLARSLASTGRSIGLSRSWSASGDGYVSADLVGARKIIEFKDPQVRDTLLVATARGATQGLQAERSFVEFKALKSAQGLAISRIADDLNVAAAPDAVIISRRSGLTLSADRGGRSDVADFGSQNVSPAVMDFEVWRGEGNFLSNKQMHLNRVVMAAPADEAAARLDYARFLMSYRLAEEAMTQLALAVKSDVKLSSDASFRALRGVSEVLANRNALAVEDLTANGLDLDPYAAAWRGLARVELGQMDMANKDFDFSAGLIDSFDKESATEMHLSAADAALAMKDFSSAHNHLGQLKDGLDTSALKARAFVLRGQLLEEMEKPQEALNFYDRAIEQGDRHQMVKARYAKAILLNKKGEMDDDAFVAELNRLRVMWRGDELERKILSRIAEKALERGQVVEALVAMREATIQFPMSDEAQVLGARMPQVFADYFLGAGTTEMTAVQALSFYYEFQDLTPIGQRGDELIRHLAERLVSIDLLAQAEVLLRYQIEQRLYGSVAKAQVAARLAGVYLLDDKPKDALQIIRATMQNQLPPELNKKRMLLEARSLASLKQYELALDLLSEVEGEQAEELRAEVYWEQQNWDAAGQEAENIAESRSAGQGSDIALSDDARLYVMRSAIAYSLGSNDRGLSRLREKFGGKMQTSVDASAFAVVSDPIETSGVAFRQLASRVAAVDMIERFVSSMKDDVVLAEPAKAAAVESADKTAVN